MTHEEIFRRLAAIEAAWCAAFEAQWVEMARERAHLQKACGAIGHLYAARAVLGAAPKLVCGVCGLTKPSDGEG